MLTNDKKEYAVHNRSKGVSLETIDKVAKEQYNDKGIKSIAEAKYELYNDLINENKIEFDMSTTKPRFKNNKNRQISSCPTFKRNLQFKGKINTY